MSILSTTLIAMSMSTDAFAAALAKGVHLKKPSLSKAMRMGLIFGTVEFLMPLLGWVIGHFSKALVENYDHWVIDVQGSELLFLKGAEKSLSRCRSIYIEVSNDQIYQNGYCQFQCY